MRQENKFFDGYNTIREYDRKGCFTLIKYYADGYYCGDRNKLFAVRTHGEDILDFGTLKEARVFFKLACDIYRECQDDCSKDPIHEILKAWRKETSK